MKKLELKINGMSCGHCIKSIEIEFQKIGLNKYFVEVGKAIVEFDENEISTEKIHEAIEEAGYKVVS